MRKLIQARASYDRHGKDAASNRVRPSALQPQGAKAHYVCAASVLAGALTAATSVTAAENLGGGVPASSAVGGLPALEPIVVTARLRVEVHVVQDDNAHPQHTQRNTHAHTRARPCSPAPGG